MRRPLGSLLHSSKKKSFLPPRRAVTLQIRWKKEVRRSTIWCDCCTYAEPLWEQGLQRRTSCSIELQIGPWCTEEELCEHLSNHQET